MTNAALLLLFELTAFSSILLFRYRRGEAMGAGRAGAAAADDNHGTVGEASVFAHASSIR